MAISTHHSGTGCDAPGVTDAEFARFRALILRQTGIHLKDNKRHLLVARLSRRVRDLGLDNLSSYYEHISRDSSGEELGNLTNLITTNKTSFFREPHHFELLRSHLIPEVRLRGDKALRIWSAGCSSGEEPYSIAMTVRDALGRLDGWDVRILASDIDTEMLEQAQSGRYAMESLEGIPVEHRRAHFLRGYGHYEGMVQVRPELRKMIDFRRINLSEMDWGVQARFDAIFCRNVIIYFDRPLQERIIEGLAGHLKDPGYFFQGHSENLQVHRKLMAPVGMTAYRMSNRGGQR